MPYSKDIRDGDGWFNTNVNCFFDYLEDNMDKELIVCRDKYCESEYIRHNKVLEEEIEKRVNEYISWKLFDDEREKLNENDMLPSDYPDYVYDYVYYHIYYLVKRKPDWYVLRSILPEDQEDDGEETLPADIKKIVQDFMKV